MDVFGAVLGLLGVVILETLVFPALWATPLVRAWARGPDRRR